MLSFSACTRAPLKGWMTPLSAGPSVVRCYDRLGASHSELERALSQLWQQYPENRYDSTTIRLMRAVVLGPTPTESWQRKVGPPKTEAQVFQRPLPGEPTNHYTWTTWTLKAANGKALYALSLANCRVDSLHCGLCLMSITFLPPTRPLRSGNWELTTQERADAKTWFEQDILVKLQALIAHERRRMQSPN